MNSHSMSLSSDQNKVKILDRTKRNVMDLLTEDDGNHQDVKNSLRQQVSIPLLLIIVYSYENHKNLIEK